MTRLIRCISYSEHQSGAILIRIDDPRKLSAWAVQTQICQCTECLQPMRRTNDKPSLNQGFERSGMPVFGACLW